MNKKIIQFRLLAATIMLVAIMVMPSIAWAQNTITPSMPQTGDGSSASPYQIGTAAELYWFAALVNGDASVCNYDENTNPSGTQQNKAACAVLTTNITVNSGVLQSDGSIAGDVSGFSPWTPIGNSFAYTGTFDGKGYTVSGLYFNDSSKEKVGLFGYVGSGGKISNVGVLDSYFLFKMFGGGVCGMNYGEISNSYNFSKVVETSSNGYAGGVCGYNFGGKVLNSYNNGIISGSVKTGGVCGYNQSNGEITNCYNSGTVSGTGTGNCIAGVCGYNDSNCTISGCYNTGNVSGINSGGVCFSNNGIVKNCYNIGTVSGQNVCGGVCGSNNSGTITSCYNRGVVNGTGGICGIIGSNSSIINCYYDSNIYAGDAIGYNGGGTVDNVMGKTTVQFNSGEVAYLLNEGKAFGTQVWGQQLGVNNYPVLGSDYKVIKAAKGDMDANGDYPYWATFSNQSGESDLGDLNVYTAKVSKGNLTLRLCPDQLIAKGEGVLVKGNSEYLNARMLNYDTETAEANNDLVATPAEPTIINAEETGHVLYRLTYNNVVTKEDLGFYLGVVKDAAGNVISCNGSQLKATPNKAYLNVTTEAATKPASAAPTRGFVFPGDGETTGIGEIVIKGDDITGGKANADGRIYNLQGQQVSAPAKGLYIKNNKKVIIK